MYRSILATTFALFVTFGCGPDYEESMKYDPNDYRAQIEEIETLLQKSANEPGDGGRLHTMSANLAGAVGKNIQNNTRKQVVMNLLISFGETFAHQEEQDIPWDIAEARQMWVKVRDGLFQQADWYQVM